MTAPVTLDDSSGWLANLELSYDYRSGKTVLVKHKHYGPLVVQQPFYPEGPGCSHTYIIHPPGGIVGGDILTSQVAIKNKAHALITTPAATKFYRSEGPVANQQQIFNLANKAILEWLPQETVYFNGARSQTKTKIHTQKQSKFIAWEIQCVGLPANNENFINGNCIQRFEIWNNQMPVLLECNRFEGGNNSLNSNWGLSGFKSVGTLVAGRTQDKNIIDAIKSSVSTNENINIGFTFLHEILIVRAMSVYAEQIREFFMLIWKVLRPKLLNLTASPPRIWST